MNHIVVLNNESRIFLLVTCYPKIELPINSLACVSNPDSKKYVEVSRKDDQPCPQDIRRSVDIIVVCTVNYSPDETKQ